MASVVTTDVLRDLAAFRAESGCAITIYLDLDPSAMPTIPDVETKINAVLAETEKEAAQAARGGRDCRLAVRDDLARIREWWDSEFDRDGVRGIAIFASSADGLFRALPLSDGAGDSIHVGPTLYVSPLAAALDRDGALVAFVSRERGSVYRFEGGRLVEVADESEPQHQQHDQGGWSQARYQRHIDHLVQQHLKAVGGAVEEHGGGPGLRLVVVGPEEMRGDFEGALSPEARDAVVGWTTAEAHAGPSELVELVRPLLDEARARDDQETLERFEELHGRGERAAAGWKHVLDAASDARVEILLLEEGPAVRAWECPQCGRASADGGSCPLDGTKLAEREDAAGLALHQTLTHGGRVVRLGAGALGDARGAAAILRY
jgi:peptide chain release factor subunit 1